MIGPVDADDNDGLIEMIQSMGVSDEYPVQGFPNIVSYNNGKYFSSYCPSNDEEGRKRFRTLEDLMEYADGIGTDETTCNIKLIFLFIYN